MFSKDNWDSTYFMIFWKFWNWPSYSRECLLYWLHWHLVVKTSSLTVKKPKSAWRYYWLWMWRSLWNTTLELLEQAYWLLAFTCEWLQNLKYTEYQPLFRTQDEWTIVKYVIEVLRPFRYWTLWMSKRHTVTLHLCIAVYIDMFDYMDGMMRAWDVKKTQWKEDLFFAVKLARQKLSKYYAEVILTTGMLLISADILNPFRKLRLFRKWHKDLDMNPEDETSYTTEYKEVFLKDVENEYCAKHRRVLVNKLESLPSSNPFPSATFRILSIILWSILFVQGWWRILNP